MVSAAPWLVELLAYLEENLKRTKAFLAEHLPQVRLIEPEGTYLIWLDCRGLELEAAELEDVIIQKGRLWLDDGRLFGTGGEGFQRINIACPLGYIGRRPQAPGNCLKKVKLKCNLPIDMIGVMM